MYNKKRNTMYKAWIHEQLMQVKMKNCIPLKHFTIIKNNKTKIKDTFDFILELFVSERSPLIFSKCIIIWHMLSVEKRVQPKNVLCDCQDVRPDDMT